MLTVLLVALVCLSATALAGDNPVSLDTSSVEDGQKDVPVDTEIELTFTNNVINASVKDNNLECFELMCGDEAIAD